MGVMFRMTPFFRGEDGTVRRLCRLLVAALWAAGLAPAVARADALADISRLAQAGARGLALSVMDERQPSLTEDVVNWIRWERARFGIMQAQGDWDGIIARAARLPDDAPADLRDWTRVQAAAALLERSRTAEARDILRRLLWRVPAIGTETDRGQWRHMLIQAYLREDALSDADIALQRYRQDFGAEGREWRILSSRVLLRGGRYAEAARVTDNAADAEELAYLYLAQLRGGSQSPQEVLKRARQVAGDDALPAGPRALHWWIVAEAAGTDDSRARVDALERALALVREERATDGVFDLAGDALWEAYLAYGRQLGNGRQLLLGQDDGWYFAAIDSLQTDVLAARALFATLAVHGTDAGRRAAAHDYLAGACAAMPGGEALIERLYLHSRRFASVEVVPAPVRYRLIDQALARNELDAASALMAGLDLPPRGAERLDWQLRRARVLILAGDAADGAQILEVAIADHMPLAPEHHDRLLQVIFDLQRVQQHSAALALFQRLSTPGLDTGRRRELLFWMAESEAALAQHARAARLFLESATLADAFSMDQWAQTARYHAAQSLAKAGFTEDAQRQYQALLNATRDASRRAVLRHQIQQLRLIGNDRPRQDSRPAEAQGT